jgi:hypothetical protein
MASIEGALLDAIEDTLRQKFGDIITERMVNDATGDVIVRTYRSEPNFARSIMLTKGLVEDYEIGTLRS